MARIYSYILSFTFIAFLLSISVNYSGFLELVNAGNSTEEVTNIPEESEEESPEDDLQHQFKIVQLALEMHRLLIDERQVAYYEFRIPKYTPESLFSPPEC